jgi:FkbM family methyltransferase
MYNSIFNRLKNNGYVPENIFDIGAHKGLWSGEVNNIYPNSNYFLFEPIEYVELNEFKNKNNFKVFNTLLSDSQKNINWYENKDSGDSIFKEISHNYTNTKAVIKTTETLNDLFSSDKNLRKIFVKIDCQGSEIPILKGASNFYDKIDFIILELPFFGSYNYDVSDFVEHINFMKSIGFVVFDFIDSHHINNFNMQVDIMFINKNHHFNTLVQDRLQIKNFNIDNSKTVAFLSNKLTLRGTEVAIFDYADYNEKILGNKSIIITRDYEKIKHEWDVDIQAYNKFKDRFSVHYYSSQQEIDNIVTNNGVTHLFIEKAGSRDGLISNFCKNIIHCVFDVSQPHGQVYTPIGETINQLQRTNYPVTPYMVTLPESNDNLRLELNIPENAIVFGRYGGKETFDIAFVHDVIKNLVNERDDVYFLFMNTNIFYENKNIIYLPGNTDMVFKRKFINTCDALIHARHGGETFGLTPGEFAICKKPVITWGGSREREHLLILKEKAVVYNTPLEVKNILETFTKDKYDVSENGYMFYNPENVMNIFNKVCLN